MSLLAMPLTAKKQGCTYWCEVFGLTTYTTAIFGLWLAVF